MDKNKLLQEIYVHKELVNTTVSAFVSSDYLLHYLEDPEFREDPKKGPLFEKALKKQFELLSLDEYEKFMMENEAYWQWYQALFLRYRKLNELISQSPSV